MAIRILWAGPAAGWDKWQPHLRDGFARAGLVADLTRDPQAPETVDYILYAPSGPISDLSPFTNAKLVQSTWAGVEAIVTNPTLTRPLARMVDPGLTEGMQDYVLGHVLRHHLNSDFYASRAPGDWREDNPPPLARSRAVGFLGLGALGMACARSVAAHGFRTLGWSRNLKRDDQVDCFTGEDGLAQVLAEAEIVVLLLPLTAGTENLLDAKRIAGMKRGASVINPGRGPLIDDDALVAALKSGQISQATLDVFRVEPLPADHPYWHLDNVLVTPHIAAQTRAETAAQVVVENIRRGEAGEPFLYLVDRNAGY